MSVYKAQKPPLFVYAYCNLYLNFTGLALLLTAWVHHYFAFKHIIFVMQPVNLKMLCSFQREREIDRSIDRFVQKPKG